MTGRVTFKHSVPISKHKQEIDLYMLIQNTFLCLVAKRNWAKDGQPPESYYVDIPHVVIWFSIILLVWK